MALNKLYIFVAASFLNIVQNHSYENHLICKSVQDVFTPTSNGQFPSGVSQGPPGKRGEPGVKGEAGRRGEKGDGGSPAIVDYQRIEQVIERTTSEKTMEVTERLQNHLNRLEEALSCLRNGGYENNKSCYTVILASSTNREKALQLCEDIGSKPADIHNLVEQNGIARFGRSKLSSAAVQFWLGMTYQPSTNTLFLSNGTVTNSNYRWYPGYPQSPTAQSSMFITIHSSVTSSSQGIFNYLASHTTGGVICMKPLANF